MLYKQVAVPSQSCFLTDHQSGPVKHFLGDLSGEMKKSAREMGLSPLPNSGIRSTTCWRLLVECCRRIPPSQLTFAKPPVLHMKLLADVLKEFSSFWSEPAPGESLVPLQTNPGVLLTKEMEEYGQWYCAVRGWLSGVQQHVVDGQITLGELKDFESNYRKIKDLYKAFMCSAVLLELEDIKGVIEDFERTAMQLTSYLLYPTSCGQKR